MQCRSWNTVLRIPGRRRCCCISSIGGGAHCPRRPFSIRQERYWFSTSDKKGNGFVKAVSALHHLELQRRTDTAQERYKRIGYIRNATKLDCKASLSFYSCPSCAFSAASLLPRVSPYGVDRLRHGKQKDHCAITSRLSNGNNRAETFPTPLV